MASSRQSWFKPALKFCGACLIAIAYWSVWLMLGATLVVLTYVAVARDLTVPDFMLRRLESHLAESNLTIRFGGAHFDPSGQVLLENVQLRSKQFEEPLLTSRLVYVRRSIWSVLSGRPVPDEIRLEGATLQLPAMLSPSGTAEPLLHDLAVVVRHEDNTWYIDQLAGYVGRLAVTARGDVSVPVRSSGAPPLSAGDIVGQFLRLGRKLVLELHQFEAFEQPALDVLLEGQIGNTATLVFTANGAQQPWGQPLSLGPLAITTKLRLDGNESRLLRLHAVTRSAVYQQDYTADNVRAVISAHVVPDTFTIKPAQAWIAVGALAADSELALGPLVKTDLTNWPNVKVDAALQSGGEFVTAEVDAHLREQSAHIHAAGRASHNVILHVLARHTPRAAPYFIFGDPVTFTADASFARGWRFEGLQCRVAAGRINSRGVKITSARGRIDIAGLDFIAYDARVAMGGSYATGSYWMNFATTDYRMLLNGQLQPAEIGGWFNGTWWPDFWKQHFLFPNATLPEADVDVNGRWREAARTEYYGRAQARSASVWGGDFEKVQARVFLRPQFVHVIEFDGTRDSGAQRLGGWLKRTAGNDVGDSQLVQFDMGGNLDPEIYLHMLDRKPDETLAAFQFLRPPQVHAQGEVQGDGPGTTANYTFSAQSENGLNYRGLSLETARVTGSVKGPDVRLDDIQFAIAGGKGAGKAAMTGPVGARQVGFDLYLNGADLARSIRAVEGFEANRTGQKTESMAENNFIKRASGGRVDIAMSAQGTPGELPSFNGTGNAALTGAELGEIHLFGLLSQALSGLSLNFSSLKLDAAHTSFRLAGGRLHFPDLKVTGPSAAIEARGDFVFETNALDFTAKFKPFEESRNILAAALGVVINPITSILELKLTGPLSKPNWSVVVGTSGSRPEPAAVPKPVPVLSPPTK